ncbi:hypothetical protein CBR_g11033 [Chara braunii]|uniref:DUF659 domain-containing protein n=1 Tax=Chara braunii TaxID=69332 RepID=A0A388KPU9_CHABU|nr:hypothetical protein CBR_g11033 [Chara braunii]|eukprot:GBG72100.1 hypothetical protein CBR_g11033 [Chara braunii]
MMLRCTFCNKVFQGTQFQATRHFSQTNYCKDVSDEALYEIARRSQQKFEADQMERVAMYAAERGLDVPGTGGARGGEAGRHPVEGGVGGDGGHGAPDPTLGGGGRETEEGVIHVDREARGPGEEGVPEREDVVERIGAARGPSRPRHAGFGRTCRGERLSLRPSASTVPLVSPYDRTGSREAPLTSTCGSCHHPLGARERYGWRTRPERQTVSATSPAKSCVTRPEGSPCGTDALDNVTEFYPGTGERLEDWRRQASKEVATDGSSKRKEGGSDPAATPAGTRLRQQKVTDVYGGEWVAHHKKAFLRWLYSSRVSFNAFRNQAWKAYQQVLLEQPCSSPRAVLPNHSEIASMRAVETHRAELEEELEEVRQPFSVTGATLLSDGRKSRDGRPIVNFLVAGSRGVVVYTTINREGEADNAVHVLRRWVTIFHKFSFGRPQRINAICTDSASAYVGAGRALASPSMPPALRRITWLTCSVHTLLALQDTLQDMMRGDDAQTFSSIPWSSDVCVMARWVRRQIRWDIWWQRVATIVHIMQPVMELLRRMDRGGQYMSLMIEWMHDLVRRVMDACAPLGKSFADRIIRRVQARTQHMLEPAHCAAFLLNPRRRHVRYFLGQVERYDAWLVGQAKRYILTQTGFELEGAEYILACRQFENLHIRQGRFGDWGGPEGHAPERNWAVHEGIHTKKRNQLAFEKVVQLVEITANVRLTEYRWAGCGYVLPWERDEGMLDCQAGLELEPVRSGTRMGDDGGGDCPSGCTHYRGSLRGVRTPSADAIFDRRACIFRPYPREDDSDEAPVREAVDDPARRIPREIDETHEDPDSEETRAHTAPRAADRAEREMLGGEGEFWGPFGGVGVLFASARTSPQRRGSPPPSPGILQEEGAPSAAAVEGIATAAATSVLEEMASLVLEEDPPTEGGGAAVEGQMAATGGAGVKVRAAVDEEEDPSAAAVEGEVPGPVEEEIAAQAEVQRGGDDERLMQQFLTEELDPVIAGITPGVARGFGISDSEMGTHLDLDLSMGLPPSCGGATSTDRAPSRDEAPGQTFTQTTRERTTTESLDAAHDIIERERARILASNDSRAQAFARAVEEVRRREIGGDCVQGGVVAGEDVAEGMAAEPVPEAMLGGAEATDVAVEGRPQAVDEGGVTETAPRTGDMPPPPPRAPVVDPSSSPTGRGSRSPHTPGRCMVRDTTTVQQDVCDMAIFKRTNIDLDSTRHVTEHTTCLQSGLGGGGAWTTAAREVPTSGCEPQRGRGRGVSTETLEYTLRAATSAVQEQTPRKRGVPPRPCPVPVEGGTALGESSGAEGLGVPRGSCREQTIAEASARVVVLRKGGGPVTIEEDDPDMDATVRKAEED